MAACSGGTPAAQEPEPPPGATSVAFSTGPVAAVAGAVFVLDIVAVVRGADGNADTSFDGVVTIAIEDNPSGGKLTGDRNRKAVAGVARFPGLGIDRAGSGYTLRVTAAGASAVSDPFDINVPAGPDGTTAGRVATETTFVAAAINWDITGDDNDNATCEVRFRRTGTLPWRRALDLARIRYAGTENSDRETDGTSRDLNKFSGSIFGLAPGTEYESELTIVDADGGGTGTVVTFTTRPMPRMPVGGQVTEVTAGDDLRALQDGAEPGDTLLFHAGDYNSGSVWQIHASTQGTAERPILFKAYGDGAVSFHGLEVRGDHVWIDGFTVGAGGIEGRYQDDPTGIIVTRTSVTGAEHCVDADGSGWFVCDNTLKGDDPTGIGGEGIECERRGHVLCFNDISEVADGVSYGDGNIDVHNNRIHDVSDDLVEPDYGWDNWRVWGNNGWSAEFHAFSFQPIQGGPWYVFRNQATGVWQPWKMRGNGGPKYAIANTLAVVRRVQFFPEFVERGCVLANNFWTVRNPNGDGHLGYGSYDAPARTLYWDHNRYEVASEDKVVSFDGALSLAELREGYDIEHASLLVDADDVSTNVPADWDAGTSEPLMPVASEALVDGGTADALPGLDNLMGPYLGAAPDVGAHERGLGTAWYGPRAFADRLAYGVLSGWSVAPLASLATYSDLGAPAAVADGRVLLVRSSPRAFLLVGFEPFVGEARWTRHEEILAGAAGDTVLVAPARFRDGLAGSIVQRGPNAHLLGSRVDADGVMNVLGGCAAADLGDLQDPMFHFLRSLYYAWSLPE
jgi:hypothetical protein